MAVDTRPSRHTPHGYVCTTYTAAEIDGFAVYCPDLERCFWVPIAAQAGQGEIHLRVDAPLNHQRGGCRLADSFAFGAVAQLGERVAGSHEVRGSIPLGSTSSQDPAPTSHQVGANAFWDRFGFYLERAAAGDGVAITRHGRPFARLLPAIERLPLAA